MRIYLKLFAESLSFALQALKANKLRTLLSLLGITIGIFSIISVFTMVDTLEVKIRSSVEELGNNVIFVQKWPWIMGGDYQWWDYMSRPYPNYKELQAIQEQGTLSAGSAITINFNRSASFKKNSVPGATIVGTSHQYNSVRNFEIQNGRFFSEKESATGSPVCVLGHAMAMDLFNTANVEGKFIKVGGRKVRVIGVFEEEGESMINFSQDDYIVVPYKYAKTMVNINSFSLNPTIYVKAKDNVANQQLIDQLTGIMRAQRRLKPIEKDDFALNEVSIISRGMDQLFSVLHMLGSVIGGFSILVGGFSIANIMFVSVKERTRIIGIQKSLGAKNGFILFQFLSESVILSLLGGLIGLILIVILSGAVWIITDTPVAITFNNIFTGISISVAIGLVSGIFPAWQAARKDPVEAIRS